MTSTNKPPKTFQTTPDVVDAVQPVNTGLSTATTLLAFTEITGTIPTRLTKIIGLNPDGTVRKETAANLSQGTAKRIEVNGLEKLRDHLDGLTHANAAAWGVTVDVSTTLCTQSDTRADPL